ncbi:MAG: acyltransferase [Alphaproteobacteria bacterium]|nr:acyltransferase [Alphaproteobacteria bacterium]
MRIRDAHLAPLDGLRGIAVLGVMLYHFTARYDPVGPVDRALVAVIGSGWSGVDLFFVLSGFLITSLLIESRDSPRYFKAFYARRFLRIFPLFYLFIGLLTLFRSSPLLHYDPRAGLWWHWLYLSNFKAALYGWNQGTPGLTHLWSLAVEEQFYLVWPFVVLWTPPKRLLAVCLSLVVAAAVLRGLIFGTPLAPQGPVSIYTYPFTRMDTLAGGAVLAVLAHREGGLDRWRAVFGWMVAIAGGLMVLQGIRNGGIQWRRPNLAVQVLLYSEIAVVYTGLLGLILTNARDSLVSRALSWGPLMRVGTYSYGMYVLHPILLHFARLAGRGGPLFGSRLATMLVMSVVLSVATFVLAAASYHVFESRFLALKKRFPYVRSREPLPRAHAQPAGGWQASSHFARPRLRPAGARHTRRVPGIALFSDSLRTDRGQIRRPRSPRWFRSEPLAPSCALSGCEGSIEDSRLAAAVVASTTTSRAAIESERSPAKHARRFGQSEALMDCPARTRPKLAVALVRKTFHSVTHPASSAADRPGDETTREAPLAAQADHLSSGLSGVRPHSGHPCQVASVGSDPTAATRLSARARSRRSPTRGCAARGARAASRAPGARCRPRCTSTRSGSPRRSARGSRGTRPTARAPSATTSPPARRASARAAGAGACRRGRSPSTGAGATSPAPGPSGRSTPARRRPAPARSRASGG